MSKVEETTNHLKQIIASLHLANRRGAFELDESASIFDSVKFFGNNDRNQEDQKTHLQNLVNMSNVAQKRGVFDLPEAHTLYIHIQHFLVPNEPNLTQTIEKVVKT